jgi:hypothetical protein
VVVVQEDPVVATANDSRSLAINAARLIPCLSSRPAGGPSCAVIVSVRIEQRNGTEHKSMPAQYAAST